MKKLFTNHNFRLWFWVFGSVLIIAVLWATVFYPASLKKSSNSSAQQFNEFRNKINNAFSIFKKSEPAEANKPSSDAEIQDLRERVFGDSVKR